MMKDKEYYLGLNYPILIEKIYDEGELLFTASIKELPGLIVYGESLEEIYDEIELAKADWIETNLECGRKIKEPQKVVVPKFVSEWIKWCKANDVTLLGGISPIDELGSAICNDKRVESLTASRWAQRNQDTFARAWLDCYEVEQDKLYTVEIGGVGSSRLFKHIRKDKYRFHCGKELEGYTDKLTEQEIKKAGEHFWEVAKPVEDK